MNAAAKKVDATNAPRTTLECCEVMRRHRYPPTNAQLATPEYSKIAADRNLSGAHTQFEWTLLRRNAWKYNCPLTASPSVNQRAECPSSHPEYDGQRKDEDHSRRQESTESQSHASLPRWCRSHTPHAVPGVRYSLSPSANARFSTSANRTPARAIRFSMIRIASARSALVIR